MEMDPPLPTVASPDLRKILPVLPLLLLPEDRMILPLTPLMPLFVVRKLMEPLDVELLGPVDNTIDPPEWREICIKQNWYYLTDDTRNTFMNALCSKKIFTI